MTALVLLMALIAVITPRFDQRDLGPVESITGTEAGGNLGDAANYVRFVEAIRGDVEELPPAPFRYRPLTPVFAAPLPLDAMTALNVVNVLALAASTMGMWWILAALGSPGRLRMLGCLLFVVSFPTFYYGTIGYVDPLAIAFVMFGTGAALTDRRILLLALLPFAALARESTVIVIPVAIAWMIVRGLPRREVVKWSLVWFAAFGATVAAVRLGLQAEGTNLWKPSLDLAIENLSRVRTWLSAALTLGVPALVLVVRHRSVRRLPSELQVVLGVGMLLSLGVFAYAILAAYADGRFLWPIYVYTVPAAVLVLARDGTPPTLPQQPARP